MHVFVHVLIWIHNQYGMRRLVARDTGLASAAPLLRSYAKVEKMTISELNNFVVSAASQEIDFLCTGRVVRLDAEKGGIMLHALNAVRNCSVLPLPLRVEDATIRMLLGLFGTYRVEMAISDDSGEGTFVWFDGVITKLHGLRASEAVQMLAEEGVSPEDTMVPLFIAEMEGNSYTFQVRVNAYNFTEHHKTFTVTRVAEDHGRLPIDDVNDNGGDDDDNPPGKQTTDEPRGEDDIGGVGTVGKTRKKTDGASYKVVKKARIG
ncbi:hypothetical protein Bca101_020526 [Brassica carinata]